MGQISGRRFCSGPGFPEDTSLRSDGIVDSHVVVAFSVIVSVVSAAGCTRPYGRTICRLVAPVTLAPPRFAVPLARHAYRPE